jgi:hypothetical protein
MDSTWSPSPGQPVLLSLDSEVGGLSVRLAFRVVSAARESPFQKFLYTPKIWASTAAGLAIFLLMGTAFASGTIRPAPPPAPTPLPGQPTPTPDTRPRIQLPGFVLEAPLPVQVQAAPPENQTVALPLEASDTPAEDIAPDVQPAPRPAAPRQRQQQPQQRQPPPAACTNFLGIGCTSNPPAPPPAQSSTSPEEPGLVPVVPVPSPGPGIDARERSLGLRQPAPAPGSNLDDALRAANIVTQNFNSGLTNRPTSYEQSVEP